MASGKGGVGKSTVTANLAVSLAKMGFSVGVLDADIYGPSMPIMFDVETAKPLSVEVDGKSKMKPIESYDVKILSIGFFTSPSQAVIWRGPMAAKALNQMIFDADWGELDFLLIDLPPGTGDIHLSIVQALPITGTVVVSTPQAVALADAKKGVANVYVRGHQRACFGNHRKYGLFHAGRIAKQQILYLWKRRSQKLGRRFGRSVFGRSAHRAIHSRSGRLRSSGSDANRFGYRNCF